MCSIKISRKYIKKKTPYIVSPNLNLAKHLVQFIEYKTPNKKAAAIDCGNLLL